MNQKSPHFVKITGGEFRGRKIATPGGRTHPMGERERLALFNMISSRIPGSRVVDLYSGGGTLAIEALSRGATSVFSVDSSSLAIEVLRENLSRLGISSFQITALKADAPNFIATSADRYDVVIADPPYDEYRDGLVQNLPKLVSDGGILVLSHPGDAPDFSDLTLEKTRSYASAHLSIYTK